GGGGGGRRPAGLGALRGGRLRQGRGRGLTRARRGGRREGGHRVDHTERVERRLDLGHLGGGVTHAPRSSAVATRRAEARQRQQPGSVEGAQRAGAELLVGADL